LNSHLQNEPIIDKDKISDRKMIDEDTHTSYRSEPVYNQKNNPSAIINEDSAHKYLHNFKD
jgi:hypothetical protein